MIHDDACRHRSAALKTPPFSLDFSVTPPTGLCFWAVNVYLWWSVMGLAFVPLAVYFITLIAPVFFSQNALPAGKHAEQVGIVVMMYAYILSALIIYPVYFIFHSPHRYVTAAFVLYVSWYVLLDARSPQRGARFVPWTRRLPFWRILSEYFPVRLHKTVDLDPSGNYLFGYHPHGIIGVGAMLTFATDATGFGAAFPGLDLRLLTLASNFYLPFTREILMALGVNSVSKRSCLKNLTRAPGASVAIVVGGAAEALDARPGWAVLTLARRKGFVKMALRTGASLVPVFAFGENDIFDQVDNGDGTKLRRFQTWVKQFIGITPPAFYGRSLSGGVLRRFMSSRAGVLPKRESIEVVVGGPIHCPKTPSPTSEQVDAYHARYTKALKELYDLHRRQFHKLRRDGSEEDLTARQKRMGSMLFQ